MKINLQKNKKSGFVLLFAVILTSIIFAVTVGILNIAFNESVFSTSGKASNDAFYAADTGAECAMYYDIQYKYLNNGQSAFGFPPGTGTTATLPNPNCAGTPLDLYQSTGQGPWTFYLPNLGPSGRACAIVQVVKTLDPDSTHITSRGYSQGGNTSNCTSVSPNRVERRLEVIY